MADRGSTTQDERSTAGNYYILHIHIPPSASSKQKSNTHADRLQTESIAMRRNVYCFGNDLSPSAADESCLSCTKLSSFEMARVRAAYSHTLVV